MQYSIPTISLLLLSTLSFTCAEPPSAGACGPTSTASVPGCWGTPGCAYVVASDLGPGAACKFDYCNCDGTNVPLLPELSSGTTTLGCASYTRQPSANNCPTAAPSIPGGGSPGSLSSSASVTPPAGAVVVTGTVSGTTITETYVPTTYSQFSTVTAVITTEIVDAQSSTVTVTVGPSGIAWTAFQPQSGVPNIPPPTYLPGSSSSPPFNSGPSVPLPPGATVVTTTVGTLVVTETFVPITLSQFSTLSSTITTTTTGPSGSPITILVGPGGTAWTPLGLPSSIPEVAPPTVLPSNVQAFTTTSPTTFSSISKSNAPSQTITASSAGQSSITGAFANTAQSETTIIAGGVTLPYSKATFDNLKTITAITTVTTPLVQTNKDGTHFTLSAAIIIVGPGGVWWNGGTGGWGFKGPSCIWPFCPPGGGGDIGGAGSSGNPDDPNTPNSPEKPSDPDDDDDDEQSTAQTSSQYSTTSQSSSSQSSSASCSIRTASDCSVLCVTPTSAGTASCSTTCTSVVTGCSATGTIVISTVSGAACTKPGGWGSVVDGDDFSDYQPLGTAGIAAPGGSTFYSSSVSITGSSTLSSSSMGISPTSSYSNSASVSQTSSHPTSSMFSGSASQSITTQAAVLSCMADGAPWYSPTSWCDCGASATYPTLPASPGVTSANCDYSSFPASQLTPRSTGTAPTNVPGQGGVPGCAGVVAAPGTSAYCNCGGTPAPTLEPTSSGLINCDYTIQPTSSYNPQIPKASTPATSPSGSTSGQCNVHIWQGLGQEFTDPPVVIDVNITDLDGHVIGTNWSKLDWGQGFGTDSKLSDVLIVTPQIGLKTMRRSEKLAVPPPSTRPLFEHGPVDFALGSQSWDSTSSQCKVGGWDNGNANDFFGALIFGDDFIPNRQMDCKFPCSIPNSKRSLDGLTQDQPLPDDLRDGIYGRSPSSTLDETPSPIDENIHLLYDRAHGAAWVKYAPSGVRYYQAWQDQTGPDVVYQCNFEDDFDVRLPVKFVPPASSIRPTLQQQGYSVGREYYAIVANGPKNSADGTYADFTNTISASQGVFLANANDRGALPSDPNDPRYNPQYPNGRAPVPWQFSTVAWWMWTKTVLQANPQWQADPSQADYSGLKSMWRREIANEDTKSILDEAFAGKDVLQVQTWTPEDTDRDSNPFWALLGSPNGNGMQYILTDNKVALKGKRVKSISAVVIPNSDGKGFYTMWATYE